MLGQLLQVVGCGAERWVAWINLIEANPIKPWTWQGRRFLGMIQFKFDVFSRTFFKSMQICWIWSIFTTSRIAVKTENLNEKSQLCTEMDEVCRHFSFFFEVVGFRRDDELVTLPRVEKIVANWKLECLDFFAIIWSSSIQVSFIQVFESSVECPPANCWVHVNLERNWNLNIFACC